MRERASASGLVPRPPDTRPWSPETRTLGAEHRDRDKFYFVACRVVSLPIGIRYARLSRRYARGGESRRYPRPYPLPGTEP